MCLSCAERQWDICCIVFSDILSSENIECCIGLHSQQVRKEVTFTEQRIFTRLLVFFFCFFFFNFLATLQVCGTSLTRDGTNVPALEAYSLNHWTTREVP